LLALAACAARAPQSAPQTDREPEPVSGTSTLQRLASAGAAAHGSDSGFELLDTGREALLRRAALIEAAEHTIDAQYYIWNSDASGRHLANRLRLAADRGVRVRILLDDINVAGRDRLLAALDAHPRIEVRIYNPFAERHGLRKALDFLWEFTRLNRRMHNKSLTVDGAFTVVGGRNIGDEYFDAAVELNFRDRDVLAAGPVVAQTAAMFATFWSSSLARPIGEIATPAPDGDTANSAAVAAAAERTLAQIHGEMPNGVEAGLAQLRAALEQLTWAPARLVYDPPPDESALGDTNRSQPSAQALRAVAEAAHEEILIESAYLVMDDDTMEGVRKLRERGVRVRALTNSLASNDVTANHAAYARRREAMVASGVRISELRPDAASCRERVRNPAACGAGHVFGLHAKTFVFDRRTVYVGSLNLNLRSRYLNAESGMVIESPVLAARVAADIEQNLRPENSWELEFGRETGLRWLQRNADGRVEQRFDHDPQTPWSRRAQAAMIAALPLEKYL
jgi:putative cardiolipin synthase